MLNLLLGKSIVPTDHNSTTTSEVRYGRENVAFVQYRDGNGKKVTSKQLNLTTEEGQKTLRTIAALKPANSGAIDQHPVASAYQEHTGDSDGNGQRLQLEIFCPMGFLKVKLRSWIYEGFLIKLYGIFRKLR